MYTIKVTKEAIMKVFSVVGVPGVGKSTTTFRLSEELGLPLFPEPYKRNPYIERCYNGERLHYLRQRTALCLAEKQHLQALSLEEGIIDGGITQVDLFIYLAAEQGDFTSLEHDALLDRRYSYISLEVPVIYLEAKPEVIWSRMCERGRDMEKHLNLKQVKNWHRALESVLPANCITVNANQPTSDVVSDIVRELSWA